MHFVKDRQIVNFDDLADRLNQIWLKSLVSAFYDAFQYKPGSSTKKSALQLKRFLVFVVEEANSGRDRDRCRPFLDVIQGNTAVLDYKNQLNESIFAFSGSLYDLDDDRVTKSKSRLSLIHISEPTRPY